MQVAPATFWLRTRLPDRNASLSPPHSSPHAESLCRQGAHTDLPCAPSCGWLKFESSTLVVVTLLWLIQPRDTSRPQIHLHKLLCNPPNVAPQKDDTLDATPGQARLPTKFKSILNERPGLSPWKGAPKTVRAPLRSDLVIPRRAVNESGCLGMSLNRMASKLVKCKEANSGIPSYVAPPIDLDL
ncbi:hypothetical protein E6C27_scaffold43G00980 [Cucumis melo var. makuwa]|uniref:Uncharacterized protein n=1 Tax=Cucumis melo var. makuwa TaxID=1194695 RepID=A0A5A7TYU8_CUCMM|nr:hypothetical protein E6C27_scaffold43G00980 [Cucumis melo var. makuwa]